MLREYKRCKKLVEMFVFQNRTYNYCRSFSRYSFSTERTIEIPIILAELNQNMKILEVGNVLHRHCNYKRDVVDKYEKGNNILNCDIIEFHSTEKYDRVVSISTLEHIGFDENIIDPDKTIHAVKKMIALTKPKGKVIISVPLGHNPYMDKHVAEHKIPYTSIALMERTNKYTWIEIEYDPNREYICDYPYPLGNSIAILKIEVE